jgi:hypothetical protein
MVIVFSVSFIIELKINLKILTNLIYMTKIHLEAKGKN